SEAFVPRAVAASVYVVNPFVYVRFHYGQLLVLGAYAVLPWVALRLRLLLVKPGIVSAIVAAISLALIGILSLHFLLLAGLLYAAVLVSYVLVGRRTFAHLKRVAAAVGLAVVVS